MRQHQFYNHISNKVISCTSPLNIFHINLKMSINGRYIFLHESLSQYLYTLYILSNIPIPLCKFWSASAKVSYVLLYRSRFVRYVIIYECVAHFYYPQNVCVTVKFVSTWLSNFAVLQIIIWIVKLFDLYDLLMQLKFVSYIILKVLRCE